MYLLLSLEKSANTMIRHLDQLRVSDARGQVSRKNLLILLDTALSKASSSVTLDIPRTDLDNIRLELRNYNREWTVFAQSAEQFYKRCSLLRPEMKLDTFLRQATDAEQSAASSSVPVLVEEYFNKAGDVRIAADRLVLLREDYQASIPEFCEFEDGERFMTLIEQLQIELDDRISDADQLKGECLAVGYEIETAIDEDTDASQSSLEHVNATLSRDTDASQSSLEHVNATLSRDTDASQSSLEHVSATSSSGTLLWSWWSLIERQVGING